MTAAIHTGTAAYVGKVIHRRMATHQETRGLSNPTGVRAYVMLDRDGTINEEVEYLSDPAQIRLIPGAAEGLRRLRRLGLGMVVLTNQSGIGRGYFDSHQLEEVHQRLIQLLFDEGLVLDGIFFCPHAPSDQCGCRKPLTGLVDEAAKTLGFDPRLAFMIGDKESDIALGQAVGSTTILVRSGYGRDYRVDSAVKPSFIAEGLVDAAEIIRDLLRRRDQARGSAGAE